MKTFEELLKNRKLVESARNSADMLECMKIVRAKYLTAEIQQVSPNLWRLACDGEALSNPHNSHYACWMEAREIMNVADQ